jgi:hypothetical protein
MEASHPILSDPPDSGVSDGLNAEDWFWSLAEAFLSRPGVTRSTMMGFPCLRLEGRYSASLDPKTRCLVIKLPRGKVEQIADAGLGLPFAPAGRVFREWVAIPFKQHEQWTGYLDRALAFAASAHPDG